MLAIADIEAPAAGEDIAGPARDCGDAMPTAEQFAIDLSAHEWPADGDEPTVATGRPADQRRSCAVDEQPEGLWPPRREHPRADHASET